MSQGTSPEMTLLLMGEEEVNGSIVLYQKSYAGVYLWYIAVNIWLMDGLLAEVEVWLSWRRFDSNASCGCADRSEYLYQRYLIIKIGHSDKYE